MATIRAVNCVKKYLSIQMVNGQLFPKDTVQLIKKIFLDCPDFLLSCPATGFAGPFFRSSPDDLIYIWLADQDCSGASIAALPILSNLTSSSSIDLKPTKTPPCRRGLCWLAD
jgi:hypothetical protein